MTPEIREFMREPTVLIVTKANVKSRVHRRVHMDYVGVKLFAPDGRLEGELRLVGLFTSTAYTRSVRQIPYLRHKVAQVLKRAGFDPESHSGKAIIHILEEYPRDELWQVDIETLYGFVIEILMLYERPRIRALARADRFDRFVSILVFIPRDKYDTSVRVRVGAYLASAYRGKLSAAYVSQPEGPLSRVHYIIGRYDGNTPAIDRPTLEAEIGAIVASWADKLRYRPRRLDRRPARAPHRGSLCGCLHPGLSGGVRRQPGDRRHRRRRGADRRAAHGHQRLPPRGRGAEPLQSQGLRPGRAAVLVLPRAGDRESWHARRQRADLSGHAAREPGAADRLAPRHDDRDRATVGRS